MKQYFFDIGSSTIKMYEYKQELKEIEEKSILFKDGFSEKGVSSNNIEKMMQFVHKMNEQYYLNKSNTTIIATGIWRKISEEQFKVIKENFKKEGLVFQIISHKQENDYFERAMEGDYNQKRVLMVNMGGKTTELVIFSQNKVERKINLTVGVADVLDQFPYINEPDKKITQEEMLEYTMNLLKDVDMNYQCEIAIHTGGELRFQKLVKYPLKENHFFQDGIHKKYVTYEDFDRKNKQLLYEISLEELYQLMPQNPSWMNGAKAGIILGQAIFKKAGVKYIVPSDLNLIHGVIKKQPKE